MKNLPNLEDFATRKIPICLVLFPKIDRKRPEYNVHFPINFIFCVPRNVKTTFLKLKGIFCRLDRKLQLYQIRQKYAITCIHNSLLNANTRPMDMIINNNFISKLYLFVKVFVSTCYN